MKIENKKPKPTLRVRIEITEFAELKQLAWMLQQLCTSTTATAEEKNFAGAMLARLLVAYPPLGNTGNPTEDTQERVFDPFNPDPNFGTQFPLGG